MQYQNIRRIGIRVSALTLGLLMSTAMPVSVYADSVLATSVSSSESDAAVSSSSGEKDMSETVSSSVQEAQTAETGTSSESTEPDVSSTSGESDEADTAKPEVSETPTPTPQPEPRVEEEAKPSTEHSEKEERKEEPAQDTHKETDTSSASREAQEANKDRPKQTNEQLVGQQHLVHVTPVTEDFRFRLVDQVPVFAKGQVEILEEKTDTARAVGVLTEKGVAYLLQDCGDGWLYVESGTVRGYVKRENLCVDAEADAVLAEFSRKAGQLAQQEHRMVKVSDFYTLAKELVPCRENQAYYAYKTTVYDRVIPKQYAITTHTNVNIREAGDESGRVVGKLNPNQLSYVIADAGRTWVYIESGDVRGFVLGEYLSTGDAVNAEIAAKGEEAYGSADIIVKPRDNAALYYTNTSIKEGSETNPIREAILKTAESCVGNPYVWGGTSLTNGADCSGFVQTLFAQYGIALPRVAEQQALYGTQIPVGDASPGDLIFFAMDGYIYHVALYIGDGQTIEAYNPQVGIIHYNVDTAHAVWATRVIPE